MHPRSRSLACLGKACVGGLRAVGPPELSARSRSALHGEGMNNAGTRGITGHRHRLGPGFPGLVPGSSCTPIPRTDVRHYHVAQSQEIQNKADECPLNWRTTPSVCTAWGRFSHLSCCSADPDMRGEVHVRLRGQGLWLVVADTLGLHSLSQRGQHPAFWKLPLPDPGGCWVERSSLRRCLVTLGKSGPSRPGNSRKAVQFAAGAGADRGAAGLGGRVGAIVAGQWFGNWVLGRVQSAPAFVAAEPGFCRRERTRSRVQESPWRRERAHRTAAPGGNQHATAPR